MRQGGNAQIRRFFKKLEIDQSPIQLLYCTKAADHYREKLKERVDAIMSGQMKSEKRVVKKKFFATSSGSFDGHDGGSPNQGLKPDQVYQVAFQEGPMGMTLTKNSREQASVSRLLPEGQALKAGVATGDFVVGVAGKTMENYDEIMHMIPLMPRPLSISFARLQSKKSSPKKTSSSPQQSSPSNSLPAPPSSSSSASTPHFSPRTSPRATKKTLPSFPEAASESIQTSSETQDEPSSGDVDTSNIEEDDDDDEEDGEEETEQTEQQLNRSIELPDENSKEPEDPFQVI